MQFGAERRSNHVRRVGMVVGLVMGAVVMLTVGLVLGANTQYASAAGVDAVSQSFRRSFAARPAASHARAKRDRRAHLWHGYAAAEGR